MARERKVDNKEILDFFRNLDRAFFIDGEYSKMAHCDSPLPIGHGQTISQPTLVCSVTCSLELDEDSRVLEIGTGSGYQTAFLAEFASEVYTVERIKEFSERASKRLKQLAYENVHYRTGDGSEGWPEYAPYDRIIVTAAASRLPFALVSQLSDSGRMIVPVGPQTVQELLLVIKNNDGGIRQECLGKVRFVEMKGKYGWGS